MTIFDTTAFVTAAFDDFLIGFFAIFTNTQFRGADFPHYLERPAARRGGDEASIVDTAIVIPLLGLLGWGPGQQTYNQGKKFGRPDFVPNTPEFGDCFVVEDKSTGLELTLDANDPESHLAQLGLYLRSLGLRAGWLTNGVRLMVWRFDDPLNPVCALDFDVANAVRQSVESGINGLSAETKNALRYLWEQFQRNTFTDLTRLEREIASDEAEWMRQALPLGANAANQELLVGAVKGLLQDLQADARRRLDSHLDAADKHHKRRMRLREDDAEAVPERLQSLRIRIETTLMRLAPTIGLEGAEIREIEDDLRALEREPRAFINWKALSQAVLDRLNAARERKHADSRQRGKPWTKFDNGLSNLGEALQAYGEIAFLWHQHQAVLRHDNRAALETTDNYGLWISLVQETMLGGLDEDQKRNEFALQAVYVVFIRLLLLRVCEDKGILWNRILSDGGLKYWQASIERYYQFATGNPYEPLLDMAYNNAQNIYAHFFTGRELFNWYTLDRSRFVRVLYQLGRFNFADVDSDLIGTIYNTYVERPEKKQKGQYYTPSQIVRYILDETGYQSGAAIIGPNKRLIDPACGSGSFLVEAARRLVAAYKVNNADNPRDLLDRVRENLYGFDLNPFACYLAEVNLLIQVLDLVKLAIESKQPTRLERFHVYNVDALAPANGTLISSRTYTPIATEMDIVDSLKSRQGEYTGGFRWVVANPPYGAGLTDKYKAGLREWWPSVFYGKPDTYVFFFALGLQLLGTNGHLGFITPNTYLMGTNTATLRAQLLESGRIEQIVDLPQGIWADANVDCALLFLSQDSDIKRRKTQKTQVFSMGVKDKLDKLEARDWKETFTQSQEVWIDDANSGINIRWTPLLRQIEEACHVTINGGAATKIQRLGDVSDSMQGIIPYKTKEDGASNRYIKPKRDVPAGETDWKPLIDGSSYVERYGTRLGEEKRFLKYGKWLWCPREVKYFDSPKILFIRLRNRALYRRLVATYDDQGFYNRHNFSNIIAQDSSYNLKYTLAIFNSSLLNYWYARQYPDVEVSIVDTRQLPIYPADAATQAELVALVDELLAQHAALNVLREQDAIIRTRRDGTTEITLPYDRLLADLLRKDRDSPVYNLNDARAVGLIRLPPECDPDAPISRVFTPTKYPETVVLHANQCWLEVDDKSIRRYLLNYLARPQWKGFSWNEICGKAMLPEPPDSLAALYAEEARINLDIQTRLAAIADADAAIDSRVLDLYGISDLADRARVLGEAPADETAELEETDEEIKSIPNGAAQE